ncbi:MAG: GNAT family N-acetyltransferase [Comamonadaceae bacterium]|nr:MAG: GNAT family N-acetyltransferase [Comamonadaceae bacterium]
MRRLATPQDIEAVFSIYSHEKVVPFLTYEPMSLDRFGGIYKELLQSGCFFVWEIGEAVAGFYKATRYAGRAQHVALLGTLAVDPRLHGQGTGHAMLTDAIERLKAEGVKRIELYAESDNAQALGFYRKLGFVHEGTLREFYKRAHEAHCVDEYVLGLLVP